MPAGTSLAQLIISIRAMDQASGPMAAVRGQAAGLVGVLGTAAPIAAAAAATAMAGAGVAAVKMGMDFEKGMAEVRTLAAGMGEEAFGRLKSEALSLSREVGIATDRITEGYYQALSAGVEAADATEFLRTASMAAIGGVTDLAVAVDGLTTVLNAFSKDTSEAEQVADVMFQAVLRGKMRFEELSASLYVAGPLAAALGVSFEEVAGAATTLTKQGMPAAEAMTSVRAALVSLQRTTPEMEAALASLGYQTGEALLKAEGFQGAMVALREEADRTGTPLIELTGRVEGTQAVLGLTGQQAQTAAEDLEAMRNAAGSTEEAFEILNETASRKLQIALNELRVTLTELGVRALPLMTKGAEGLSAGISGAMNSFALLKSIVSDNKELLIGLATVVALRVVVAIVRAARDFLMLVRSFEAVRVAGIAMSASMLGPLGIVAALTAAAAAVVIFRKQLGMTETDIVGLNEKLGSVAEQLEQVRKQAEFRGEESHIAQLVALAGYYDELRTAAEAYHEEGFKGRAMADVLAKHLEGLRGVASDLGVTFEELLREVVRGNVAFETAQALFPDFENQLLRTGRAAMEAARGMEETGDAAADVDEAAKSFDELAQAVQEATGAVGKYESLIAAISGQTSQEEADLRAASSALDAYIKGIEARVASGYDLSDQQQAELDALEDQKGAVDATIDALAAGRQAQADWYTALLAGRPAYEAQVEGAQGALDAIVKLSETNEQISGLTDLIDELRAKGFVKLADEIESTTLKDLEATRDDLQKVIGAADDTRRSLDTIGDAKVQVAVEKTQLVDLEEDIQRLKRLASETIQIRVEAAVATFRSVEAALQPPAYQYGGRHPGGPALVGEVAPELLWLPAGTNVQPIRAYQRGTMPPVGGVDVEGILGRINLDEILAKVQPILDRFALSLGDIGSAAQEASEATEQAAQYSEEMSKAVSEHWREAADLADLMGVSFEEGLARLNSMAEQAGALAADLGVPVEDALDYIKGALEEQLQAQQQAQEALVEAALQTRVPLQQIEARVWMVGEAARTANVPVETLSQMLLGMQSQAALASMPVSELTELLDRAAEAARNGASSVQEFEMAVYQAITTLIERVRALSKATGKEHYAVYGGAAGVVIGGTRYTMEGVLTEEGLRKWKERWPWLPPEWVSGPYDFGGIVPGPLGMRQLALVEAGERILPPGGREQRDGRWINYGHIAVNVRGVTAEEALRGLDRLVR